MLHLDSEPAPKASPLRQGDIFRAYGRTQMSNLWIVVTADCDIAQDKFGDGLACVPLVPLSNYLIRDYAATLLSKQLKKRFRELTETINNSMMKADNSRLPLPIGEVENWLNGTESVDIIDDLTSICSVPVQTKNLISSLCKIVNILKSEDSGKFVYGLCLLNGKDGAAEADIVRQQLGKLDPTQLPQDAFFLSEVPGEEGMGFIAKLRQLVFVPRTQLVQSVAQAKEHESAYLRVGRLIPTFKHALAQQLGNLYSRIGLPLEYEESRLVTFELVVHQLASDWEKTK